ncbi:MAG: maleylpyruvate isomerase N-terminal domain-containing protein [Candidatus Nanopelagicales bacterium]|jgi:uncharacterized protein (TIGR03083 family)
MAAPLRDDAGFDETFAAWRSASTDFIELVTPLSQEEWDAPTALPGWSVGDIVAHVGWIEGMLIGEIDPAHEPDWPALPHVVTDFGRITEVPVDLRRSWTREAVLVELADRIARRTQQLESGPQDPALEVVGPLGPAPLGRVLRMRTLDTWVHEQDIRDALGRPGHLDTPGAQATAAQLLPGLGKVWAKLAGAQPGEVLDLRISGPGIEGGVLVAVGDDGRARIIEEDLLDQAGAATVTLAMTWPAYLALSCGRGDPQPWRDQVRIDGDPSLAARTLDNFRVMI